MKIWLVLAAVAMVAVAGMLIGGGLLQLIGFLVLFIALVLMVLRPHGSKP